jgi:predicted DNA-binding transcriptional regulator YafY
LDKGKICYLQINVSLEDDKVIFPFGEAESKDLARSLTGCKEAIIFACTLGTEFDNILRKYSHTDMSKAVIMQAIGTERIEALCDTFMDRFGEKCHMKAFDDEHFIAKFDVAVTNGLVSWIMQFGDSIKVKGPKELKNMIIDKTNSILALYNG